ncbi:hypothetical protein Tco_0965570 [Tanacetum coccineum]
MIFHDACPQPQSVPQIEYPVFIVNQQSHIAEFPQIHSGLAVPVLNKGDDPIDAINKMMRVTVQPFQGRTNSYTAGASGSRVNTAGLGGRNSSQQRVVKVSNGQGEVSMQAMQRNQKGKRCCLTLYLNAQSQTVDHHTHAAYQTDDLDANAPTVMTYPWPKFFELANLSCYVTDINKVNEEHLNANKSLSAELERYKERVELLKERRNIDLSTREKLILEDVIREKNEQFADLNKEINFLKQTLSDQLKEKESSTKTFTVFKMRPKKKKLGILIKRLF